MCVAVCPYHYSVWNRKVAPGLAWLTGVGNLPPATNSETVFSFLKDEVQHSSYSTIVASSNVSTL